MVDGWDICIDNIGDAMRKAKVLDIALQDQVYGKLKQITPRPSIYDPDYIAANQVSIHCLLNKRSVRMHFVNVYFSQNCIHFVSL